MPRPLSFLYPVLWPEIVAKSWSPGGAQRAFRGTSLCCQETFPQRYGSAKAPEESPRRKVLTLTSDPNSGLHSLHASGEKTLSEKSLARTIEKDVAGPGKKDNGRKHKVRGKSNSRGVEIVGKAALEDRTVAIAEAQRDPARRAKELSAAAVSSGGNAPGLAEELGVTLHARQAANDLSMLTAARPDDEHRPPHLAAPPYVHHFDSYSLVKELEQDGFSDAQSVTIMKAVRGLLAVNMEMARDGLVSKSDVENETYLFRAACSELRTEILNLRRSSTTKQQTQLSHLQHSHDILSQRTAAELASLRDELKGMLDDRRMAARANSMVLDSQISELNYKISVALNSDAKSDVEGLRWLLTRRAAMAIAVMAILILGSLRWRSHKLHEREVESQKAAESRRRYTSSSSYTTSAREMGTQTGNDADARDKTENVGYVSLG